MAADPEDSKRPAEGGRQLLPAAHHPHRRLDDALHPGLLHGAGPDHPYHRLTARRGPLGDDRQCRHFAR